LVGSVWGEWREQDHLVSDRTDDEIEGIANRLALLVSEGGEADNAGRAVGAMARRLGMSGGDLKAIFLAGATAGAGRPSADPRIDPREVAAMGRKISALHHNLTLAEVAARNAQRERDALRKENQTLQAALLLRKRANRATQFIAGLIMAGLAGGIVYFAANPVIRLPAPMLAITTDPSAAPAAASADKLAIVRAGGTRVYSGPNKLADVIVSLPAGTRLNVRRLVVNVLLQWAEVDYNNQTGYVVLTDLDMP
jgi:hypothetical protein